MVRLACAAMQWRATRLGSLGKSQTLVQNRSLTTNSPFLNISEEVQQAVAERRPVVALESTIYTHGFPYPANLALASRLESLVRVNGGVPATIGILDGIARVGMGADELMRLVSTVGSPNLRKVSRRDFGFVLGQRGIDGKALHGGTTISATMILANLAGIRIFATGGLGGVHRGVEETMDVSADLTELGRTPVAVVSSGCKSFLDIPRTLEYLETQGVAVATFADGREGSVDFPAFYTRDSGVKSPMVLRDEEEAATIVHAHMALGLQSGLHFANPIPEEHSIPFAQMETAIAQALNEAKAAGEKGAAITPIILAKIKEITGDQSVAANKSLVEANVIRGTKLAAALQKLEIEGVEKTYEPTDSRNDSFMTGPAASNYTRTGVSLGLGQSKYRHASTEKPSAGAPVSDAPSPVSERETSTVFVAGSLNVDLACDFISESSSNAQSPELQTSNRAKIAQSLGGVGYNVARAAHLMGASVHLCSAVGDDLAGRAALAAMSGDGMSTTGVQTMRPANKDAETPRTSQYVAINDGRKDLMLAMADVSILEQTAEDSGIVKTFDNFWLPQLQQSHPTHLVLDANWPSAHIARWVAAAQAIGAHVTFEPVSTAKSTRLFHLPAPAKLGVWPNSSVSLTTPNQYELAAMHHAARESGALEREDWWLAIDALGLPSSGARTALALATSPDLVDQGVPQQTLQLLPFIPTIATKLGSRGVLVTQLLAAGDNRLSSGEYAPYILSRCANGTEETLGVGGVYMRLFPAAETVEAEEAVSVNGVGDTFAGTLVAGLARHGKSARVEDFVDVAQRAACLTLKSSEAVSPGLGTLSMLL
ncbi:IdgA domain protein [Hortaea werneckii]|nr:IdgA domain protein [Hortaea werneckii]KAI6845206.1 IdgA domain protein [Hortaea werneckii]KAI6925849.1 IdgA domain protein [Hortaea werneckii]KAI6936747.1 IdgA domain protein [Hortaea werneckii]KAI6967605.1 IdgA domain protein [Hortaea werneckii]